MTNEQHLAILSELRGIKTVLYYVLGIIVLNGAYFSYLLRFGHPN